MNCYFDTSIYNQILDDSDKDMVIELIKKKHITTIPSLVNLCEILKTTDADRKQNLLSVYDRIRNNYHALKPFTRLLRDALIAIQKGNLYIELNMPVAIDDNTEQLCRDALKDPGKGFDEYALKARELFFGDQKITTPPDARVFFQMSYDKRMIPVWIQMIKQLAAGMGIKELNLDSDLIWQIATDPKSFWKYYLDTMLLILHRRAMRTEGHGRESNPGGADLIQGLYLAWADIFVIKDNNFYGFLRELKNIQGYGKEIFTYHEFKHYLGIKSIA
jgi:hypothetical protein